MILFLFREHLITNHFYQLILMFFNNFHYFICRFIRKLKQCGFLGKTYKNIFNLIFSISYSSLILKTFKDAMIPNINKREQIIAPIQPNELNPFLNPTMDTVMHIIISKIHRKSITFFILCSPFFNFLLFLKGFNLPTNYI